MTARSSILFAALALSLLFAPHRARADAPATPVTLRLATLAPAESPWGKVFKAWQRGVRDKSHGALEVQIFYGNTQGDELAMVGKMRTRQLDGAALTATGLAQIYRNVLVFQLPGLFRDWDKIDAARTAMRPMLDAEFEKQGFEVVGWGDVGIAHLMTKGFEVRSPADLKHKACFYFAGDPIGPVLYQVVGDVVAKQLTVPEILPALTSGSVNVITAPSLAAEQLQWTSLLDHIQLSPAGIGIGAFVLSSAKLAAMPADLRAILLETGDNASTAINASVRNQDALAFARLKARMTPYDITVAEQEPWRKLFVETNSRLRGTIFDPKVFDMAVRLSGVTVP